MSKMDNLRAMREARYAEAQKRAAATPAKPAARPPVAPPAPAAPRTAEPAAEAAAPATDDLCGHRNMSGRTCTRERGHAQKSHRYS
jgi:hypothetical protein